MKNAGMTICAALALMTASWGTDKPPKKFHMGSSQPHHTMAKTGEVGHTRASASASALQTKSQASREKEVERLEHQNAVQLRAPSRQRSSKATGSAPRIHPEPTGRSSTINFNYHSPRTQSTSGSKKH